MTGNFSLLQNIKKSYYKNLPEITALRRKHYPDYIYEKNPGTLKGEIPVFTFHSVEPNLFEEQLMFLYRNNYQTLGADEFYEMITGSKPIPGNSIVLTFDDGWFSVWGVAFPLLKKYGFRAVCFLIPGLIGNSTEIRPNMDDFWSGRTGLDPILKGERGSAPLCSWNEIRKMEESGTIDFQSHSMYHYRIFTSPAIEDFIHPKYDCHMCNLNVPVFRIDGRDDFSRNAEFGMPVYTNQPRFLGAKRFYDDESLRNDCMEYVDTHGGLEYFENRNWRKKLFELAEGRLGKNREGSRYETDREQSESMHADLLESRIRIEREIRGKTVRHLCYPWWAGSPLSVDLSRKAGYLTNFWGINAERRTTNKAGEDPYRVNRFIGDVYVFRLPGNGRKSLTKLMEEKICSNYKGFMRRIGVV